VRQRLGFGDNEIVCVYSGRLTEDKNPLLLARAIHELRALGAPFRGLFLGSGPQAESIAARSGCVVHPFIPVGELGDWYRAAEIGVWPTQESLSMLDASACGLPIIANDRMGAPERLEGCGLAYRAGDVRDLKDKIGALVGEGLRRKLGWSGARRVKETSSWKAIAAHRLADYEAAFARSRRYRDQAAEQAKLQAESQVMSRALSQVGVPAASQKTASQKKDPARHQRVRADNPAGDGSESVFRK
jgi:glycosyltransferase involved in cell wall biosynthesis